MSEQIDWPEMRDNPGALAAFMLRLVDQSPDRLAIIEVPHEAVPTDDAIDAVEAVFIREYDRAKTDRPNLSVALKAGTSQHPTAALLVAVHEHRWVGGYCVHGCSETRETLTSDTRRHPDEFLDEAREIVAGWEQKDDAPINPASADQMQAANRDARRIMGEPSDREVVDVSSIGEREIALVLAITAATERRGLRSQHGPGNPRPEIVDLTAGGRAGHCDICDARAHRLIHMESQYGPYIFRTRACVRCRKFAPPGPEDS